MRLLVLAALISAARCATEASRLRTARRIRGGQFGSRQDDALPAEVAAAAAAAAAAAHDSLPTRLQHPHGRGRGRERGRGRGRDGRGRGRGGYHPIAAVPLDTPTLGEFVRNLTEWQDLHASAAAFAVGNALFLLAALGRKALVFLWLGFVAAFAVPRRQTVLEWVARATGNAEAVLDACRDGLDSLKSLAGEVQDRFFGSRLPMG